MPGVVFLVCIPSTKYQRELENGKYDNNETLLQSNDNLNINLPENNSGIIKLEVELRDKNIRAKRFPPPLKPQHQQYATYGNDSRTPAGIVKEQQLKKLNQFTVPMEKVLEELLKKLNIENVVWSLDKMGNIYQVVFPLQSGDPCETTLHCLTELGIGSKLFSSISVLPCSVSYDALKDNLDEEIFRDAEEESKWNNFVESIKSKLTVKQVVDGVRAGGALSFDYLLLIVTADSLAALGLVENNAPNIVAAMLVSPLMGPVMSITFGAIISDRELMKVGFISLGLGIFISILFGFIFGLILGTTDMPWGFGDWPTEEMKGRGNARSLWMGVLWALTSGTGVAVALLQGSAGPLIGVAISASLLPPVVNCGLFWALACIWLIYDGTKIPHLKGEPYTGNSSYVPIYTDYIPTEFLINGIVSALLTVVNVICIFITAIIVLKIKEVAAPYTASPDLRRFWETDIRTVRKTNQSTIRRKGTQNKNSRYEDITFEQNKNLETVLEQAIKEATDDETYRKVKRMSYSNNAVDEVTRGLPISLSANNSINNNNTNTVGITPDLHTQNPTKLKTDLEMLDKLVTSLLEHHNHPAAATSDNPILNRLQSKSRRRSHGLGSFRQQHNQQQHQQQDGNRISSGIQMMENQIMPTIMEQQQQQQQHQQEQQQNQSNSNRFSSIRRVFNTISNVPNRLSQSITMTPGMIRDTSDQNEENINLRDNLM